jgi:4-amino-4-deoxy-L-arabinose transferase-like glycosyltransferase
MRADSFARRLGAIAGGALLLRVAAALFFEDTTLVGGDGVWYLGIAKGLPRGDGFVEPLGLAVHHVRVESAVHPPLYALFLSVIDAIGVHSILAHRIWSCIPGTIAVVLIGLVARELLDERAGLIAAGAAAVSIPLVAQDVALWSEGTYAATIAFVVLAAYRYIRRPGVATAVVLGIAVTLSTMTRAESALLYPTLLLPLIARARVPAVARVRMLAAALFAAAVLLAPWFVYNAGRFREPVVLSNGLGGLLVSSNCDVTYSGPAMGGWGGGCAQRRVPPTTGMDESQIDRVFRRVGWEYAEDHASELPKVIPVRLLRTFGFWRPVSIAQSDLNLREAGIGDVAVVAVVQYWLYLVIGVLGLRVLVRARRPVLPLLAPVLTVVVISVIGYGTLRFRIALDAVLPVVVGVALSSWWSARARVPTTPAAPPPEVTDDRDGRTAALT